MKPPKEDILALSLAGYQKTKMNSECIFIKSTPDRDIPVYFHHYAADPWLAHHKFDSDIKNNMLVNGYVYFNTVPELMEYTHRVWESPDANN